MINLLKFLQKIKLVSIFLIIIVPLLFLTPPNVKADQMAASMNPDSEMSLNKFIGAPEGLLSVIFAATNYQLVGSKEAGITGAIPLETKYLSMLMIERPASTDRYIAHLMDNIGLPTPAHAHAQGIGYRMFNPIINLWQVFRDLAYTIYILIFLVIGFMIMFRTKINAQTIISVQSALPNLIITLLLITFSYAIAGFLVDIMYFLIYFLVYLVGSHHIINPDMTMEYFLKHSLIGIFLPSLNPGSDQNIILQNISIAIENLIASIAGSLHHTDDGTPVISWLLQVFISFMVFWQLGTLFIGLLKSYLMVIIQIITAPLQLLFNAIPGSNSFSTWLKTLASYLAPFPIITAIFLMAIVFTVPADNNPFGVNQPIFGNQTQLRTFPYISGRSTTSQDIAALVSFALILISPAAVKMSQDFFKVKESPYTSEIGAGIKAGFAPIGAVLNWRRRHRDNIQQTRMANALEKIGQTPD